MSMACPRERACTRGMPFTEPSTRVCECPLMIASTFAVMWFPRSAASPVQAPAASQRAPRWPMTITKSAPRARSAGAMLSTIGASSSKRKSATFGPQVVFGVSTVEKPMMPTRNGPRWMIVSLAIHGTSAPVALKRMLAPRNG